MSFPFGPIYILLAAYQYGNELGHYKIKRKQSFSIGKEHAYEILSYIKQYYEHNTDSIYATDVGTWTLKISDINHHTTILKGSMIGDVTVSTTDLSILIRNLIPIPSLEVFGSSFEEEEFNTNV